MVSLKARHAMTGVGLWLVTGCPTAKPLLPALPSDGSGGDEGSSGSQTGATSTGPSSTSDDGGVDTSNGSEQPTGGEPSCGLQDDSCEPASAPWWDPAWAHRRRVDVGAALIEPLADAVVPVRLDAGFEHGCARADGADLRFVDDDGMPMAHELDEWIPGSGSVAWVRVPMIDTTGASFWLYYGNDDAPAPAEPAEVWPQALGYQAVLHFGGDLDDARGLHDAEPAGAGVPAYVDDGVVGRAIHYEQILVGARATLGGSDQIDDAIVTSQAFSVVAWIRSTPDVASPSPSRTVVSRGSEHWSVTVRDPAGGYDFFPPAYASFNHRCQAPECAGLVDVFGNHSLVSTMAMIEHPIVSVWHHVAATYEATGEGQYAKRLYVDGELDESVVAPLPLPWAAMALHTEPLTIGAGPLAPEEAVFHGEIDELRIASRAWDDQRIRADHAYVDRAELVTMGAAECR